MAEGQSLCSTQVREDGIHGVGLSGVVEPFFFYLQNWEQIQALIRMYESGKTYKPLYVRVFLPWEPTLIMALEANKCKILSKANFSAQSR